MASSSSPLFFALYSEDQDDSFGDEEIPQHGARLTLRRQSMNGDGDWSGDEAARGGDQEEEDINQVEPIKNPFM